jgi:recombination protein RecA
MPRRKAQADESLETLSSLITSTTPSTTEICGALSKYLQSEDEEESNVGIRYYLDTGNIGLNYIISGQLNGGYSSGLVTELYGDPSTGKTLLMMVAAAKMQQQGGIVAVADVEGRWDWDFAKVHGVDPSKVLRYKKTETVEDWSIETDEILNILLDQEPMPQSLFILDSIASLSTYWEMEAIGVKEDQGKKAKRLKAAMRVIPKKLYKANAILIASNHVIDNPKLQFVRPQAPGGRGFPFQSSIRLELLKPVSITPEGKNRPIGATLRLVCVKNSICPPFGETEMNVTWAGGLQKYSGLVEMMADLGILSQAGGWCVYKDKKFRAKDLEEFIKSNPEILEEEAWSKPYFLT